MIRQESFPSIDGNLGRPPTPPPEELGPEILHISCKIPGGGGGGVWFGVCVCVAVILPNRIGLKSLPSYLQIKTIL